MYKGGKIVWRRWSVLDCVLTEVLVLDLEG